MSDLRSHHYLFAHRELASAAFNFGAGLVAAGREGRLTLDNVWNRLGQTLPEAQRLPADGLTVSHHVLDTHEALLVTLSPPEYPAEAYFVAVVLSPPDGAIRYFTLEDALSPMDGRRYTVMAEWTADQRHLNYGSGPVPEPQLFLTAVQALLHP